MDAIVAAQSRTAGRVVRRIVWPSLAGLIVRAAPSGSAGFVIDGRSIFYFLASSLPYITTS
jgi:hypothetical protein